MLSERCQSVSHMAFFFVVGSKGARNARAASRYAANSSRLHEAVEGLRGNNGSMPKLRKLVSASDPILGLVYLLLGSSHTSWGQASGCMFLTMHPLIWLTDFKIACSICRFRQDLRQEIQCTKLQDPRVLTIATVIDQTYSRNKVSHRCIHLSKALLRVGELLLRVSICDISNTSKLRIMGRTE